MTELDHLWYYITAGLHIISISAFKDSAPLPNRLTFSDSHYTQETRCRTLQKSFLNCRTACQLTSQPLSSRLRTPTQCQYTCVSEKYKQNLSVALNERNTSSLSTPMMQNKKKKEEISDQTITS